MNEYWMMISVMIQLLVVGANLSVILWFRKESREDWVRCQNTIDSIRDEMKDFHERLLDIESRRR